VAHETDMRLVLRTGNNENNIARLVTTNDIKAIAEAPSDRMTMHPRLQFIALTILLLLTLPPAQGDQDSCFSFAQENVYISIVDQDECETACQLFAKLSHFDFKRIIENHVLTFQQCECHDLDSNGDITRSIVLCNDHLEGDTPTASSPHRLAIGIISIFVLVGMIVAGSYIYVRRFRSKDSGQVIEGKPAEVEGVYS